MMKYFEWAKQLPEDERARLLRVYPDVRRVYDKNGETGITEFRKHRKNQLTQVAKSLSEVHIQFSVLKRIHEIIDGWNGLYDPTKSIIKLVAEHSKRLETDKEYADIIELGSIKPIIYDAHYAEKFVPFVYLSDEAWSKRLIFTDSRYAFDSNLNLLELTKALIQKADDLTIEFNELQSYDSDKATNTLNFIISLENHLVDATTGYFPELVELRAYLLPDKITKGSKRKQGRQRKYADGHIEHWKEIYFKKYKGKGYTQKQIYDKIALDLKELKIPFCSESHFYRYIKTWDNMK